MIKYLVRAFVYLMVTALEAVGVDLTLTESPNAPEGATSLGTTALIQVGVAVLTVSTGTGPTLEEHFVGYWTASGA